MGDGADYIDGVVVVKTEHNDADADNVDDFGVDYWNDCSNGTADENYNDIDRCLAPTINTLLLS